MVLFFILKLGGVGNVMKLELTPPLFPSATMDLFYSITSPYSFSSDNLDEVLHSTCIVLLKRPSELGLNVTFISVVLPGRTGRLSHRGEVQPQVVTISRMTRG